MAIGVRDRLVQKIISVLSGVPLITQYVGDRIYGAHLSLVVDYELPAISIHIVPGGRRQMDGAMAHEVMMQIEPWFSAVGANGYTWDDVFDCYSGIVEALHREKLTDSTIGIKVIEMTQISKGGSVIDPYGIMHIPSKWKAVATL